jgi:hypothetical protein
VTWGKQSPAYTIVFGDTENAGYMTFYDALYIPQTGHNGRALHTDVLTVHHQKYYSDATEPPADWDDPNPVPFLSATGKYLLALSGPSEWIEATFGILKMALLEAGVGGKTSSGYGRLKVQKPEKEKPRLPMIEALKRFPESKGEEKVVLQSNVGKKWSAQVKVSTGQVITCQGFPTSAWNRPGKDDACWVDVTRQGERPVKAVFKRRA